MYMLLIVGYHYKRVTLFHVTMFITDEQMDTESSSSSSSSSGSHGDTSSSSSDNDDDDDQCGPKKFSHSCHTHSETQVTNLQ